MPRQQNDIETERERLVEIACAVIEERGGQPPTLADIAARAGIGQAQVSRFFENKEVLFEAIAEYWFRPKVAVMEHVVASDLPARRKMYEFFAQRYVLMHDEFRKDPIAFKMYVQLGDEYFEQVRSYIDLADHYLSVIIGEAMGEGAFAGLEIDETISLVNQMVAPYCAIPFIMQAADRLSEDKLARIVDAMFDGLSAQDRGAKGVTGLRAA